MIEVFASCRVAKPNGGERLFLASAGDSPAMAAQKMITGYDPASMQVVRMDTVQVEDVPPSEEEYLDDMVRIWRRRNKPKASKVTGADGQQQSAARSKHAPQGEASGAALKVVARKSQWRPQQTPRLGRDELIVVLKPRATLDLKASFAPGQAGVAVRSAIRDCGEVKLSVWPVWEQNVLVCGLNSEEAARKLAGDVTLVVEGRQLPFRGHLKASGDICKGAIQVDPRETSTTLKQKLRWPHGDILSVRKLGGTDVAVVTFEGTKVPRQIFYSDQGTPVRLYKKTIPACHRCGTVGHRADICPRPQPGRCGQCGSQVATTPEGPTQHECTPCCLICGGSHLTGAAGCVGKYRKPIKPSTAPNNIKRATSSKQGPPTKVKDKKPGSTPPSKSGQAKPCVKSGTQAKSPHFTAGDFPPLDSVQHKVSSWVKDATASSPSPSPTELALQRHVEELRRQNEILARKIQQLEAKQDRALEPMHESEPAEQDDNASVSSGNTSVSRRSVDTVVAQMPTLECRMGILESKVEALPGQILEAVRGSIRELIQAELAKVIPTLVAEVAEAALTAVQDHITAQFRSSRSRSRSPRPEIRRRKTVLRHATGSLENIPAVLSPEMLVPLSEASATPGTSRAQQN